MTVTKGIKVLIIEDEVVLSDVLDRKLEKEGFDTIIARDGKAGLEMAIDEQPDVILLDLILPKLDGLSLLSQLRASEKGKDIKVIILSNLDDAQAVEESKAKGVNDYLVKTNWSLDDVVDKIKQVLARV